MLLPVFEKYHFLQSLGWGIANSLWQAAILWSMYLLTAYLYKKATPLFRYNLSLLLLFTSFGWFITTVMQNYFLLTGGEVASVPGWLQVSDNFSNSLKYLSLVYLVILVVQVVRLLFSVKSLVLLKNSPSIKPPVKLRLFTAQTAQLIGIRKLVSVWFSEQVDVPSVLGYFKPVILLPVAAMSNLGIEQAEAVILHELAHIRRNDFAINLLQSLIETILFFNPFAHLLSKAAKNEREQCCDDWVLNFKYGKRDYANALLLLEESRHYNVQLAMAATNGKKTLLHRVKRLFTAEPCVRVGKAHRIKLAGLSIVALALLLVSIPVQINTNSNNNNIAEARKKLPQRQILLPVTNLYSDMQPVTIINDEPVQVKPVAKRSTPVTTATASRQTTRREIEVNRALINEELLHPAEVQSPLPMHVSNKPEAPSTEFLVKIEEEQSGAKGKNTYILQLTNSNGNPEIIPLIILNKKLKKVTDTLSKIKIHNLDSLPAATSVKTRITS